MFCPNCGNKVSTDQRFCRSCGLGLEKIAQSLNEQVPSKLTENLQARSEKLEKLGVAALSVFCLTILSFIAYGIFYKLLLTQGKIMAGMGTLAALLVIGCGLLSVILFAKANEVKQASGKRRLDEPQEPQLKETTRESLPEGVVQPQFSVADRTTELLSEQKKR